MNYLDVWRPAVAFLTPPEVLGSRCHVLPADDLDPKRACWDPWRFPPFILEIDLGLSSHFGPEKSRRCPVTLAWLVFAATSRQGPPHVRGAILQHLLLLPLLFGVALSSLLFFVLLEGRGAAVASAFDLQQARTSSQEP